MGDTRFILSLAIAVLLHHVLPTFSVEPLNISTDQMALLTLKAHVSHDPQNLLKTNWSAGTDVCSWIGVSCGSKHPRVTALNLTAMNLTGTIPPALGNLSFLTLLNIRNNSFHGSLPIELANLRRLKYLILGGNGFEGKIRSWFGSFTQLETLSLYNNDFMGVIPSSLGNLTKLEKLLLYNNTLEWQIPISIGNLSNLQWLHLGINHLSGRVPTPPPSLRLFVVSDNKLAGDIPSSICNLRSIEALDFSKNNLVGTIPQCLGNLSFSLLFLDLWANNFHGSIPRNFSQGCSIRCFNLNNNQLEGSLPQSLVNCKGLENLNVAFNNLNDTFPHWLRDLGVKILILQANRFYGQIDDFDEVSSSFSQLQIIDISRNDFNGHLPIKFFENLHAMRDVNEEKAEYMRDEYDQIIYYEDSVLITTKGLEIQFKKILTTLIVIDFSNNRFKGRIPKVLGELHALRVFNLSHNSLIGHIPSLLGNLSLLESLDLSSNKFKGRIPMELVNLMFLEVLNLSWNNLTGFIPQGSQFNTFKNNSYIGNLGLCGLPLSKRCEKKLEPHERKFDEDDDDKRELNWKFSILMGYGCGLVFGLSVGYIVFTTRKPWWFIRMIERVQERYVR